MKKGRGGGARKRKVDEKDWHRKTRHRTFPPFHIISIQYPPPTTTRVCVAPHLETEGVKGAVGDLDRGVHRVHRLGAHLARGRHRRNL